MIARFEFSPRQLSINNKSSKRRTRQIKDIVSLLNEKIFPTHKSKKLRIAPNHRRAPCARHPIANYAPFFFAAGIAR
jgi:hypothetical protein